MNLYVGIGTTVAGIGMSVFLIALVILLVVTTSKAKKIKCIHEAIVALDEGPFKGSIQECMQFLVNSRVTDGNLQILDMWRIRSYISDGDLAIILRWFIKGTRGYVVVANWLACSVPRHKAQLIIRKIADVDRGQAENLKEAYLKECEIKSHNEELRERYRKVNIGLKALSATNTSIDIPIKKQEDTTHLEETPQKCPVGSAFDPENLGSAREIR